MLEAELKCQFSLRKRGEGWYEANFENIEGEEDWLFGARGETPEIAMTRAVRGFRDFKHAGTLSKDLVTTGS